MFNLPNNTPYVLVLEADKGYILMTSRWTNDIIEGQMGPQGSFKALASPEEVLAAVETFLEEKVSE